MGAKSALTKDSQAAATETALSAATLRWFDEFASDGIVVTDTALTVRGWNRWLENATGLTAGEMIGRRLLDAVPSLIERGLDHYYAAALSGEVKIVAHTLHQFIFPATRPVPQGGRMTQSGRIAPLYDGSEIVGTITIVEDVSERVASERELRAQIATAHTARLAAESASRVKDEFLATLSHEIRTPLNAVLGWTRILRSRDEFDEPTVRRAIEVIDRNAMSQLTLISDMLDMARISAGKIRLDAGPVDLVAVTMAAIDVIRPSADAKRLRVIARLSHVPPVVGDAERLQQVIWNLLSNAVKFTDADGTVTVTLESQAQDVRLTVSDTGQGISSEFLPEIFQRFKQAEGSSTRRHGGLGLGLALVHELVALHRGSVHAASPGPGLGATFTVTLPAQPERASAAQLANTNAPRIDESSLAGVQVLIVEDDPDAREILARIITDAGGGVTVTSSSAAALKALRDSPLPNVIVTDIGMPTEDGYTFLRALRQGTMASGRAVPAVALTAFATPADRTKALRAGFSEHLSKPFAPALLVDTVVRLSRRT
jgi:PAS domain S-box-containing protein